ncbi:hypothetical protein D3C87_1081790 [compost metagenome]
MVSSRGEIIKTYILPQNKRVLFCPKCKHELYLDGTSSNADFLYCPNINCYTYFRKTEGELKLEEVGSYHKVIADLKERGLDNWPGIPTSIAYKSKWARLMDYFKKNR